jgi:hypothetical protein
MLACPYCHISTAEEFNFCAHCYKQVKCLNPDCQSILLADKPICLKCGRPVGTAMTDTTAPNRYVREVRQTKTTFLDRMELQATDAAVAFLAPVVGGQLQSRPPRIVTQPLANGTTQNGKHDGQLALSIGAVPEEELPFDEAVVVVTPHKATMFARFFEMTGEKELTPNISDYKGESKKQQQERFILLFVGAYEEQFGTPVPSKEMIVATAQRGGIYDSNFARYISQMSKKYMVCANGSFKLNTAGKQAANLISSDVDDSEKVGIDWNGGGKSHRKVSRVSAEEQSLVKTWVDMDIDLGRIEVKTLESLQQAMLALWSLTVELKVIKAAKPGLLYMYLTQKHTTISGKQNSFMNALAHKRNKKIFQRNAAGEYYLTPEAEKQIESWRVGKTSSIIQDDEDGEDDE